MPGVNALAGFSMHDRRGVRLRMLPCRARSARGLALAALFVAIPAGARAVTIAALGDSLTAADYIGLVGRDLGVPVLNLGIGGQDASAIGARYGAVAVHVVVAGDRIVPGDNRLTTVVPELFRAQDLVERTARAEIAGISGSYRRTRAGPSLDDENRFTPDPGQRLPVTVPPGSTMTIAPIRPAPEILIVCLGRNPGVRDATRIKAVIAALHHLQHARGGRFLLLAIPNLAEPAEWRGTPGYAALVALNDELRQRYPGEFLDIRRAYVDGGNPALAADRLDRLHDTPAASLRADQIHYNDAGRRVWAGAVERFIIHKGWLTEHAAPVQQPRDSR